MHGLLSISRFLSIFLLYSLSYGEVYGPGVTYTVSHRATINAPPPMGPLGGLMGDPGASFSKYPRGGLTLNPNPSYLQMGGNILV